MHCRLALSLLARIEPLCACAQFITGSLLNFVAFTFASASILVPIEAVQFVVNVGFNKYVNGKPISCRMLSGVALTILGTVLCVVFGSTDARCFDLDDLVRFWTKPLWWVYLVVSIGVASGAHMVHASYAKAVAAGLQPRYAHYVMPASFAVSSALFGGSQMIVHSKVVAELFELQLQMVSPIPLAHWFFYLEMVLLSGTGIFWMLRMNTSLALFDPLFIIPLLQSSYILFGVISGGIYFEEFAGLHNGPAGAGGWPLFIIGMMSILSGLALIAPPPSEAGLPTSSSSEGPDGVGPKLVRKHRVSKEGGSHSSTTRPSGNHSPRTRTSPPGVTGWRGETYAAACTDSAGCASGITLSRMPGSRSPLAHGASAAAADLRRPEEEDGEEEGSHLGDSLHGGSRQSDPGSDDEIAPVHLSGRLEKLTKAVGRTAAGTVGTVGHAAAGAVSAVGSVSHAAVGAVGAVGTAVGSAVGGTRHCSGMRPPPLAAADRASDPITPAEVAITLEEGDGEGITPVAEDDPSPLVASPPRTPRTPPSEVMAGAERSPAEATTSRLGKVYTSPI